MSRIPNLLLLVLLAALFAAGESTKHTNIDYISFGYDIYLGNPHSYEGVDPGFKIDRIFDLTYNNGTKSSDGKWDIPDGVTMARNDACTLNFESTEIRDMSTYKKTLEVEVSVSGGVVGIGSFKGSTEYKSMEKSMKESRDKYFYSTAVCDVYRAKISAYHPPRLHPEFIYALKNLPTSYDEQAYMKFLDNYGTHAMLEIKMGARYGAISSISEKTSESFESEKIGVSYAASAAIAGISGAYDVNVHHQTEWGNKYKSKMTSEKIISIGAKPVHNRDAATWAAQVIDQPMPIRYTLIPISEIITLLYVRDALDDSTMNSIRANLNKALGNFCNNYLKAKGLVENCGNYEPSRPERKFNINSCKWCSNACGGDFPVDGGHYLADVNWANWHFSFDTRCSGSYGNHDTRSGVHLCCQKVDSDNRGQCRMCSSCGGDFPTYVGAGLVNEGWKSAVVAYNHQCNGNLGIRSDPGGGLKMCCQKSVGVQEPICHLCSSCGGTWPHENGILGASVHWDYFFRAKGRQCSGPIAQNDASGGMKWCCQTRGSN